jgi:hypothetical protein
MGELREETILEMRKDRTVNNTMLMYVYIKVCENLGK